MALTLIDQFSLDFETLDFPEGSVRYYRSFHAGLVEPTLLLIPGWAGPAEMWQRQLNALCGKFNLIILDYPGFSCSTFSPGALKVAELDFHGNVVNGVLAQEKVNSCIAVGHSIGGALALTAANQSGSAIKTVIGADSFTYMDLYPKACVDVTRALKASVLDHFNETLDGLMDEYFPSGSDSKLKHRVRAKMGAADAEYAAAVLENFMLWDLDKQLAEFDGEVIAISAKDTFVESRFTPLYGQRIKVHCIKNSGHFVMLDQAELFNHKLLQILQSYTE